VRQLARFGVGGLARGIRAGLLEIRRGDRLGSGVGGIVMEAAAVACHRFLDVFGEVVPHVPPIRHLYRLGCAEAGAFGVGTGTVPADDLYAWVGA
jgi:hypothetical protein